MAAVSMALFASMCLSATPQTTGEIASNRDEQIGTTNVPSVTITAPSNNQVFEAPTAIGLVAKLENFDRSVIEVEFFVDGGTSIGRASQPFSVIWFNPPPGVHSITARIKDTLSGGLVSAISAPVSVTINASSNYPAFFNAGFEYRGIEDVRYPVFGYVSGWQTADAGSQVSSDPLEFPGGLAPEGSSAALLMALPNSPAWISQDVYLPIGTYKIGMQAASVTCAATPHLRVLIDGIQLGATLGPGAAYEVLTTSAGFSVATAGINTIRFEVSGSEPNCVVVLDELKIIPQKVSIPDAVKIIALAGGVPGAPTIGTATRGNASATVTFTPPTNIGGSAITSYTATSTPGTKTGTCKAPCTSITVSALTNGTAYTFTVKATNGSGASLASAASNSVTPATVPGAPTIGTAVVSNASAAVAFTVPASNGGAAITTYTATSTPGTITGTCTAPCVSVAVTGLTNGTAYTFKVKATNSAGTGASSAASNSVTPAATVPGVPTIGTATAGNTSASVSFTVPASNGGSAITSYRATAAPGGLTGTCTAPCTSISVAGLTNGTAYTFTVKAINAIGTGAASGASNSVTPATVPGAPTIGTATAGNTSASVSFTVPVSNGGNAITSYSATSSPGGLTGTCTAPCTSITVAGLTNGTTYTFSVKATNAVGSSAASAASNSVTPNVAATVPGAPTIGTATAGSASASVMFTAPASNGGSAITSYRATAAPGGLTGTCTAPCTSITVTGLTNGTAYTFSVKAINAIGTGAASGTSNSVTPSAAATVPGAPTIGTATAGSGSASVTFTAPASNGGSPITSFTATSTPGSITGSCAAPCTTITVTGLAAGTAYTFTVQAVNAIGTGAASALSNSVTPSVTATVPDAPVIVGAVANGTSVTVSFYPPNSDGGSLITAYTAVSNPGGINGIGTDPPIIVNGLNNGTAYTFTVTATNAVGTGLPSDASNSVTTALLSQVITAFTAATPITFSAGGTFTLSAMGGASGNPVIFGSANTAICTVTGNIVSMVSTGTCALTADQAGNLTYQPAPQRLVNVVIEPFVASPTVARLITPNLPYAILGQPYSGALVVSSSPNVTSVTVTGLPAGVTASHNGSGTVALVGTPAASGDFVLMVTATSAAGVVNLSATLNVRALVTTIDSLSAGGTHSCVVFNGGVRCWGYSNSGGLGNGTTTIFTPAAVVAIGVNSGATSVSAGPSHSCAVVSGGVQCWGSNSNGQLGNSSLVNSSVPVTALAAGSGVTGVSAGERHSCVVVNGGVRCWGYNQSGQLGNGSTVSSLVPVIAIADGSGVTAVATGRSHTCVIISGGVQCWGSNGLNELGNGFGFIPSSVPVVTIPAGSGVIAISAGSTTQYSSQTCVVIGGGVQCWGSNNEGKLGGFTTDQQRRNAIDANSAATAVAAGGEHTCAVVAGGVKCWGQNTIGQLGAGFSTNTVGFQGEVFDAIPAGSNVTAVTAGQEHTCAVVNGFVQCWGNGLYGRLGNIVQTDYMAPIPSIQSGSNVVALTARDPAACAVMNGHLQCWGPVGSTNPTYGTYPAEFLVTQTVSGAAANSNHLCAIVDGNVLCRGDNSSGQFGNGSNQPLDQPASLAPGSHVSGIAVGFDYTCAVVNGGVQCWGGNSFGQLGNNTVVQSLVPVVTIAAGGGATVVSSSSTHSCAVVNNGVQCWGSNGSGQLGNNSVTGSLVPTPAIPGGSAVTGVSAGAGYTCAVVNGGVQCWGNNAYGQLGIGSTVDSLVPVQTIPAGSNVTAIAAGKEHTCAVVNGGVQCWGSNRYGELGNNTINSAASPYITLPVTAIPAGSNVIAIAVGVSTTRANGLPAGFSCAVVNGGAVCWGSNSNGALATPFLGKDEKVLANITNFFPPSAPTITGTALSATSVTLTFTPPSNTGGTPITGYGATCSGVGNLVPGNATAVTISGLVANVTYNCTVYASNIIGTGPASNAVTVLVASPLTPPTVFFTLPTVTTAAPGTVTLRVNAGAGAGTLTLVEIYDGTTLLASVIPSAATSYIYTFDWAAMTLGNHTLIAKATNSQGITTTSSRVFQILPPPTIVLSTASSFYFSPATIDLTSVATPAPSTTITKVQFFANNGVTNQPVITVTFAPYNYKWLNVAAGNYALTAVATDSQGIVATSAPVNVVVAANVSIQIVAGLNGSTVDGATVAVTGTVLTPQNSAVTINGQLATLTASGQFFINDLPLNPGTNTITAIITAPDGQTANQVITINRSANTPPFGVSVGPGGLSSGASIDVDVAITGSGQVLFGKIAIECASPGGPAAFAFMLGTYQCTYTAPGTYTIKVTVLDAVNVAIYSAIRTVNITSALLHDRMLRGIYNGMLDRLRAGNINGALNTVTSSIYDRFQTLFNANSANLPTIVNSLGTIQQVKASGDFAELLIMRNSPTGPVGYFVYLIRAEDGIWRIDSM